MIAVQVTFCLTALTVSGCLLVNDASGEAHVAIDAVGVEIVEGRRCVSWLFDWQLDD